MEIVNNENVIDYQWILFIKILFLLIDYFKRISQFLLIFSLISPYQ